MKSYVIIILLSAVMSSTTSAEYYDLNNDGSITQFVTKCLPLNNIKYEPIDLVKIDKKYTSKEQEYLRKSAYDSFLLLNEAFYKQFKINIKILSAYRSYEYQKGTFEGWRKSMGLENAWKFSSIAGYSEHQLGLAIDIWSLSPKYFKKNTKYHKYYQWLQENAWQYGYINSYQSGVQYDGYNAEARHRRYVGTDFAKYLYDNKLTFSQYYKQHHSINFNCGVKEKGVFKIIDKIIQDNLLQRSLKNTFKYLK